LTSVWWRVFIQKAVDKGLVSRVRRQGVKVQVVVELREIACNAIGAAGIVGGTGVIIKVWGARH
jgi:hypothetical protein